jgi:hypothetical protein
MSIIMKLKNAVVWDVWLCGFCEKLRFGGT